MNASSSLVSCVGVRAAAVLFTSLLASAFPPLVSGADNWTGVIRCEIQVTAPGYSHQETQTWTLTDAAPTTQGASTNYPAMWAVTGQGWHDRTGSTSRRIAKWTASVPGPNQPMRGSIAFFRPNPNQLHVQLSHAQLGMADGYRGTDQYFNNSNFARTEQRLVQRLYEWRFDRIEAAATDTQLTGSKTSEVRVGIAPLHPGDAQVMITVTWALGKGTAPPLPPSTLPAQAAPPALPGTPGSTTASVPPPATPANPGSVIQAPTPAGAARPTGAASGPRLLSVTPSFTVGDVSAGPITLTGDGTHWQQGVTTVDFGPNIRESAGGLGLRVLSPTSLTLHADVMPTATLGPRAVTVRTGSEVVTLPNAIIIVGPPPQSIAPPQSITPAVAAITKVTPATAPAGARALSVSITGSATHFVSGSWVEFGELVGATSFTVHSPTSATAVINIDPAAPPGPRTVSVMTPTVNSASIVAETASLANGFTVGTALPAAPTTITTARMTPFDPKRHGFRFVNDYRNSVFGPPIKFFTRGLCGGMSYAALDYYLAGMAIPQQTFRPAHSTVLQEYIYRRQETSLLQNLDKWSEYDFNPFGSRNLEIFNWGLRERLVELRSYIDRGTPVQLGLKGTSGAYVNDHQVLAIGYDMGRYKGDVGQYKEDLKIFLCEPNYPGEIITMMADPAKMEFYYPNKPDRWRSYFVDGKYAGMTPPTVANPIDPDATRDGRVHALVLSFHTGDEELRGGSLQVNLKLLFNDGTMQEYPNISRGGRWLPQYVETVEVVLTTPRRLDEMRALEINTTNTVGPAGDRWDLENLGITAIGGGFTDSTPFKVNNPVRYKFVGLPLVIAK